MTMPPAHVATQQSYEDPAAEFFRIQFKKSDAYVYVTAAIRYHLQITSNTPKDVIRGHLGQVAGVSLADLDDGTLTEIKGLLRKREVLQSLISTRNQTTVEATESSLHQLNPITLDFEELFMLSDFVRWEAKKYLDTAKLPPHLGCFGTGGDHVHTLNISTISSVIASHFLIEKEIHDTCMIKLGTAAITGKFGSADVAAGITQHMAGEHGSRYIKLQDMGFPYSPSLREARRRYAQSNGHAVDPYKALFPGSNLTNAEHTVTGYSKPEQFGYLKALAERHKTNSTFVISARESDELLPGDNQIVTNDHGRWTQRTHSIRVKDEKATMEFLNERETKDEQVSAAIEILKGKVSEDVITVIAHNVAIIVKPKFPDHSIEELAHDIGSFLQSQEKNATIVRGR